MRLLVHTIEHRKFCTKFLEFWRISVCIRIASKKSQSDRNITKYQLLISKVEISSFFWCFVCHDFSPSGLQWFKYCAILRVFESILYFLLGIIVYMKLHYIVNKASFYLHCLTQLTHTSFKAAHYEFYIKRSLGLVPFFLILCWI